MGVALSSGGRNLAVVVPVYLARVGSVEAVTQDEASPHKWDTAVERNAASHLYGRDSYYSQLMLHATKEKTWWVN